MHHASPPALLRLAPPLLALLLAWRHGPALIDDAYITFRYSENLVAGHGLVFNAGEWVLGTTSALMALLVAVGIALGMSAATSAWLMSMAAIAVLVFIVEQLAREALPPWSALAVATAFATHPALAYVANSGMETALSMAAVYGAFALALRGHGRLAGLSAGLATLLRPDGVVVVALLLAWSALRDRRQWLAVALCAALVVTPAALAAWHYYGGLAPHSVAAKLLIHAEAPLAIAEGLLRQLAGLPVLATSAALAALGTLALLRVRSNLLLIPAWLLLQAVGLIAARIAPLFPWYFSPFHAGLLLLAAIGVASLTAKHAPRAVPAAMVALALALVLSGPEFNRRLCDPDMARRTQLYLALGEELAASTAPGAKVFLGEVGAMAWAMPKQVAIDSAGINSPRVYAARRADHARLLAAGKQGDLREGSLDWVREIVSTTEPALVVTYIPWLHIEALARDAEFAARYERMPWPREPRLVVYRRRTGAD